MPNSHPAKNIFRADRLPWITANSNAGITNASGQTENGAKASGSKAPRARARHMRSITKLRLAVFSGTPAVIDDLVEVHLPTIRVQHIESQIIDGDRFTALG